MVLAKLKDASECEVGTYYLISAYNRHPFVSQRHVIENGYGCYFLDPAPEPQGRFSVVFCNEIESIYKMILT